MVKPTRIFASREIAERRVAVGVFAIVCLLLVSSSPALADNHFTRIEQVMVGANGDTDIQFIEMKFQDNSQNVWDGVTRLRFHDATGMQTGLFVIPNDPPDGSVEGSNQGISALIATQEFVDLTGLAATQGQQRASPVPPQRP